MKMLKTVLLGTAVTVTALPLLAQDTTINMINPLPRSTNFFPLVVGEALGYFEAEGITVNLLPSDTSIPYVAFLQNGQADLAMLDPVETVNAINAGAPIATVYEVMQNAPEGIGVLETSEYDSIDDLIGTTVGLVSDRDRSFLQAALNTVGSTIDDVETVVLGEAGPTLAAAVRDGNVSAISGAAPDWISLNANGIPVRLITPEELLASPANTFAANTETLEEKRAAMEGFLRAWSKGMYVASVNPEAVAQMLRKGVPAEWENEEAGQLFLDMSIGMNVSVTERLGDLQTPVWDALQPRLLSSGAIEAEVDEATFLNDTYIAAANDFDRAQVEADAAAWLEANP
ncbi:NitT/TauT family transport system substrate-binding protein [Loktanella fryxellensis]|uniref:NitT/TauT family transport system substrate-binding protein n=1 Tax=Loktanella fryxellensis TaxID=245187 RepID=A0A1H8C4K6_9RHOB|nr:ABC transporter substrate-binding protein [Loktanella fryxellensis]SEM90015.1 NitT/TauT family transport system substrate-binding protein [Loktanella fryxellensis]